MAPGSWIPGASVALTKANTLARLSPKERLQPSLLDRLTDDRPDLRYGTGEVRVLSVHQLRERVRQELASLLNATSLSAVIDLDEYPEVARSGANYGIRDLTGQTRSSVSQEDLEESIKTAILRFEPRLIPPTLQVHTSATSSSNNSTSLVIQIEAELWSKPLPEKLRLRTVFSLEDGQATVESV